MESVIIEQFRQPIFPENIWHNLKKLKFPLKKQGKLIFLKKTWRRNGAKKDKEMIILEAVYQVRVWEGVPGKVSSKWEEVNNNGLILSLKSIFNKFKNYFLDFCKSDKLEIIQPNANR